MPDDMLILTRTFDLLAWLRVTSSEFLASHLCNHIHGVYDDWTDEMLHAWPIEVRVHG